MVDEKKYCRDCFFSTYSFLFMYFCSSLLEKNYSELQKNTSTENGYCTTEKKQASKGKNNSGLKKEKNANKYNE